MGSGKLGGRLIDQHRRITEAIGGKEKENAQGLMSKQLRAMGTLFRRHEIDKSH